MTYIYHYFICHYVIYFYLQVYCPETSVQPLSRKSRKKVHFSNQRKTGSFFCRLSITCCQNQQKCTRLHFFDSPSIEYRGQPEKCNLAPFLQADFLDLFMMPENECSLLLLVKSFPSLGIDLSIRWRDRMI